MLQAVSDWEVASAEISTLSEDPEELPEKVAETEKERDSAKAAAKQEKEEVYLKMAESQVEEAAEFTSTCPLAVTLAKCEMSRRLSQSLLPSDVDAPEQKEQKEQDEAPKEEKVDKESAAAAL